MTELAEEIRRDIGQHFVFGFHGHEVSSDIRMLICDYYVGNVILMKRNVESIVQVRELVSQLQVLAKDSEHTRPLMIGIDQENGLVSAFSSANLEAGTQFPGAMALAATGSVDLAEQVSFATGKEMRLAGINWDYSPVADINSDPRNPVIGVRSFGDEPHGVARFAQAVSRGLTSARIAPAAKHFPGHGNTHIDSHLSLPRILTTKDGLAATELVPFRTLIDGGIASIMTGHMALPRVTGDETPCSLSRQITTGLLREEMGFKGVIVTDCLEMDAVAEGWGVQEGAVRALEAGADVVMICHRIDRQVGAVRAAYDAFSNGRLDWGILKESGTRVSKLKNQFAGGWDQVLSSSAAVIDASMLLRLKHENAELSKRAYASSVAMVRPPPQVMAPRAESINLAVDDAEGLLRDRQGRLRNTAGPSFDTFCVALARRVAVYHIVYAPGSRLEAADREAVRGAVGVVFNLRNGFDKGRWQMEYIQNLVTEGGVEVGKVVLVSTCSPYDVLGTERELRGLPCFASFEFTVPALSAVADVLFGEAEAVGRVPVKVD